MADSIPLRRYIAASAVALAPSFVVLIALYWSDRLAGRPTLVAMAVIGMGTIVLVRSYLGSLARFARFVGELSDEREPIMPRLSFAPATEELATAAATLSAGWRRQRASIDNLAASAQAIVDGLPDPLIAVDRQRRVVRTNRAALMLLGALALLAGIGVALAGEALVHFYVALVLVGVGWNFLYVGATALLTQTCRDAEKPAVQAFNDSAVFLSVTLATLFAGRLVDGLGWEKVNLLAAVPVAVLGLVLVAVLGRRRAGLARGA